MQALYERNLLDPDFPFRLFLSEGNFSFPHHWHEEIEIIYIMEGKLKVGINDQSFLLEARDILILSSGDVHCFLSQQHWGKFLIIQFGLSLFDSFFSVMTERKFIRPLFGNSKKMSSHWNQAVHEAMEKQILSLHEEYNRKQEGYRMALKARLYDLVVILLRKIPTETYSSEEKNKQLSKLERLENIFQFVEENFQRELSLEEVAKAASFSEFHFTRFFKAATGITFGQYLSHFRITKAEWYLADTQMPVTEVAFKAGFNSVKTFNRVFKQWKDCSPTAYRRAIIEK